MKKWNKFMTLALAVIMGSSFAACTPTTPSTPGGGGNSSNSFVDEDVDSDMFQLNVSNFDGGYGSAWLGEVKKRYEALRANDTFEGGKKKGVQVMIHPIKTQATSIAESVVDGIDHVYFTEYAYYYDLKGKDIFADITEAVTGDLGAYGDAAGTTIESKLSQQQIDYYKVDGKYYGIPHYAGYGGLTYNRGYFDEMNYYFAAAPQGTTLQGKFITEANPVKAKGPDGVAGTFDDGLPATYEEFFLLCDWIVQHGETPIMLNGNNYKDYAQYLTKALATDYEGLDQMMLNYTFDGTATDLATIDANGNVVLDAQDTPIDLDNGYELARQAGKAYAVQFIQKMLMHGESKYMNDDFDGSLEHTTAQELYLGSVFDSDPHAMLIDGIWWQSEATQAFSDVAADGGAEYSKAGSNFAWMPLPKATTEKVGSGITLFDQIYSLCFMKKGITGEAREVALDFIKFCYTQESLVEFTQYTDSPKAVNYTMSDAEMANLTSYCKSILEIKNIAADEAKGIKATQVVYPYASSAFYQANQTALSNLFQATVDDMDVTFEAEVFVTTDFTAKNFFDGIYTFRQREWTNWKNNASAVA